MARLLTFIGVLVTILYSVFIYCLINHQLDKFGTLPLNELGDFLAGVFGPLAIFWLILGFLQQGKELQQSTKALELQAKELKNSVEQQKGLVNATKEQITEIRRASIRPNLEIYLQSNVASMQLMDLHLENTGPGTAKNIKFTFSGGNSSELKANEREMVDKFIKLNMLKTGVSSLAPKEKRSSFIFSFSELSSNLKEELFKVSFEIQIEYFDTEGYQYISTSVIDLGEYEGITELGGDPSYKLYKEIEKIRNILEGFQGNSSSKKLKVDLFTSEDREAYQKSIEEHYKSHKEK